MSINVTLRQLRAFLAVARQRHFHRAAAELHLTQPAVSRQVADLERALGMRLLDRSTREVVPTAAGRHLQHALERILGELDGALAQARDQAQARRGVVHVAAGPTPAAELMPACIARCARDWPQVAIHLRDLTQHQVLESIQRGEVDFGVAIDPPDSDRDVRETIMHDAFVLACRPDHPLAGLKRIAWKKLGGQPLVLLDHTSGSRRLIDEVFRRHGIDARVMQQARHTHTVYRMVEAGLGASVMPGLAVPDSPALVTRPLTPRVRRAITLVRRRHRSLSPVAELVWDTLREVARQREQKPSGAA